MTPRTSIERRLLARAFEIASACGDPSDAILMTEAVLAIRHLRLDVIDANMEIGRAARDAYSEGRFNAQAQDQGY